MKKNKQIFFVSVSLLTGLLVFASHARCTYITAYSLAGYALQTYPSQHDLADGWDGDYIAEVEYHNPGLPITTPGADYAYTKGSLTGTGIELKSLSYAPDTLARSRAYIMDYFTLETTSGSAQSLLDAALSFELTGELTVFNAMDSEGILRVSMRAFQDTTGSGFGSVLDIKDIDYTVSRGASGQYVGTNADDLTYPYPITFNSVTPTSSTLSYYFDIPLSLDLDDMLADIPVRLELSLYTSGMNSIVDFSNTFTSSQSNPFLITSSPQPGTSYQLSTEYNQIAGVSLFGSLDGEIVGVSPPGGSVPVPEPSTFLLLGSGLAGLAFVARRRRKE